MTTKQQTVRFVCVQNIGAFGFIISQCNGTELLSIQEFVPFQCPFFLPILCRSVMPACAAMHPGAPITPPPGWIPLPHNRSLFIGVNGDGGPISPAIGRLRNNWSIVKAP